jgi:hypothetical protein
VAAYLLLLFFHRYSRQLHSRQARPAKVEAMLAMAEAERGGPAALAAAELALGTGLAAPAVLLGLAPGLRVAVGLLLPLGLALRERTGSTLLPSAAQYTAGSGQVRAPS